MRAAGEGEQHFQQPADRTVHACAAKATKQAEGDGDDHGNGRRREADQQALPCAVDDPRKDVAP